MALIVPKTPYRDLNSYFRRRFGQRVHKISVDAGLTCPNRDGNLSREGCIFCNARGSGTGALSRQGLGIADQIRASQSYMRKRFKANKFIVYFQSFTNTYAPIEKLRSLWTEALSVEDVIGLSIGTRPDCVSTEVLDLLQAHAGTHMIWMEYGLQSVHDDTLQRINRGHDLKAFIDSVRATQHRGIHICAHMILGLPAETAEHMHQTADVLAAIPIDAVKLHLLYVVKGTRLERMYRSDRYRCLSQDQYIARVCDTLERLPQETLIQRVTSDPHPYELVAPGWALDKDDTISRIAKQMHARKSRQGLLCNPQRGRQWLRSLGIDLGEAKIEPVNVFDEIDSRR